jgi:hypothetical protein
VRTSNAVYSVVLPMLERLQNTLDRVPFKTKTTHILLLMRDCVELPGVDIFLDQMRSICSNLAASVKAMAGIFSIGICVPGFINPATETSIKAENIPGWSDILLKTAFE